eukprot:13299285-Alexandrium_andersonii.AAC.1
MNVANSAVADDEGAFFGRLNFRKTPRTFSSTANWGMRTSMKRDASMKHRPSGVKKGLRTVDRPFASE